MDGHTTAAWVDAAIGETRDFAVILTDPDGVIVAWLGAASWVFGYAPDEAIGQRLAIIFAPEDVARELDKLEMAVALAAGRSEDDRWHVRKGGTRFWGSGVLWPVHLDGSVVGFCKALRDRTDVRTRIDALEHRIAHQADKRSKMQTFLLTLGHELRSPLGAIVTAAHVLEQKYQAADLVQVIKRQTATLTRLVDDVSQAAKTDSGIATRLRIEPVVLQEALRLAAFTVQAAVDMKNQQLRVIVPETPIEIEADPTRLQQMVANLLSNATKYTPRDGHITLSGSIEGSMVVVRVEDDGIGIDEQVLPTIFDMFTRESTSDDAPEGLGVGLAVVKLLTTLHGGGIEARSNGRGKGSVFSLRLPLRPVASR
jgi:PAS domain S-box-containing protein